VARVRGFTFDHRALRPELSLRLPSGYALFCLQRRSGNHRWEFTGPGEQERFQFSPDLLASCKKGPASLERGLHHRSVRRSGISVALDHGLRRTTMPEKATVKRARKLKRSGRAPSTQAGEFVREEIHHIREGKHGAASTKQAIAIGLSKARRAGVKLPSPPPTATERTKQSAASARRAGQRRTRPSPRRSRAAHAALEREPRRTASKEALSRQARGAARRRTAKARNASARKAARTKGPRLRHEAAQRAARTRKAHGTSRRRRTAA
jgi:Family of unknown function (DUF6496)